MKTRHVSLGASTLMAIKAANEILNYVTNGHVKEFSFATVTFEGIDHAVEESQLSNQLLVTVEGKGQIEDKNELFPAKVIVHIEKAGEYIGGSLWKRAGWSIPTLYADGLEIALKPDGTSLSYYSANVEDYHRRLVAKRGFHPLH